MQSPYQAGYKQRDSPVAAGPAAAAGSPVTQEGGPPVSRPAATGCALEGAIGVPQVVGVA